MRSLLRAARVITPDDDISPGWVLLRDGSIEGVGDGPPPDTDAETLDLGDQTLVPGFVDIHVHGGGGFSLLDGDREAVQSYARWVANRGVTSFLATVCSSAPAEAIPVLESLALLAGHSTGSELLGANLEGPFVASRRLGALPPSWANPPDPALLDRLIAAARGNLRLITIAPELPAASALISQAVSAGVKVSIGHTDATFDEAAQAFRAGAAHVTHALNAMRPFHQRDPAVIGAALEAPGVTIEVVADGVHLHPATVRLLLQAFGPDRVALVTDAVTPAGLERGTFRIGQEKAVMRNGRITLLDGTIAGSAATMDQLVRNVVQWKCATLPEAVRMASTVPGSVAGASRKGRIAPGYDADLVALTPTLAVAATWLRGSLVSGFIGSALVD
jgi:N-acetylglucosamine-6-phosphate deacetylase